MAGRKRTPTAIKELTGNPGKRALPTDEPKPVDELEFAPDFLDEGPREHWSYTVNLFRSVPGVSKAPDQTVAALFCQAIYDFVEANRAIEENGGAYQDVETKAGGVMTRIHPAVGVKKEAMAQILRISTEFGLTPASRSKLKSDLGAEKKNPNDKYFAN